ncbi:MAG TPA: threonylcarbamoyl-AMP synthase [Thermoplasmata archaeon]|nr:threonylcarbamoyl-AMP synthase [Thermoplasmata archaeon]
MGSENKQKMSLCILSAVDTLKKGKLVVYPTETLYGLGAVAFDERAVKKVFEAKQRPLTEPISIAVNGLEMVRKVARVNMVALKLYDAFLPGPLTLILKAEKGLSNLLVKGGKLGVRVPSHPIALKLITGVGAPLTSTSANLHGGQDPISLDIAKMQLGNRVSLYIEGGVLGGLPSTVVELTSDKPKVLRESIISKEDVLRVTNNG